MSIIGFIFPIYAYSTGASVMDIGLIYSMFSLCTILMRPLVGRLIDKKGRKPGIIIGILFYLMVNVLFLLGKNLKYLMIAKIFQSVGGSFLWISVDTMIHDISHKDNRSENFGSINQTLNRGSFLGSIIGFNILYMSLPYDSIKVIFSIYLVASIVSLYYGMAKIEETLELKKDIEEKISSKGGTINRTENFNLFLLIPIAKSYYYIMIIEVLLVIAGMFYGPAQSALVIDFIGDNHRGRNYGIYKLGILQIIQEGLVDYLMLF